MLDDIPRCLDCEMILTLLPNDIPENLRMWCKDCQIVWLLPSNYFEPITQYRERDAKCS